GQAVHGERLRAGVLRELAAGSAGARDQEPRLGLPVFYTDAKGESSAAPGLEGALDELGERARRWTLLGGGRGILDDAPRRSRGFGSAHGRPGSQSGCHLRIARRQQGAFVLERARS